MEIELVEMEGYDAAVQLSNLGACDLNVVASTDNPSASVSPSGTFIAAGGSQLFLVTLTDGPGIDGTTVYFETDHCGTYAVHIDSTSVPPGEPEDTTGVPPGEFE